MKKKLLIVGGFPTQNNTVFGGVVTDCKVLSQSILRDNFEMYTLDSTQKSNPPPIALTRLFLSIKKNILFAKILFFSRPHIVMLFVSPGLSLLEKGFMSLLARVASASVFLYPVGGAIVLQYDKSLFNKLIITFCFKSSSFILCQGEFWYIFCKKRLHISDSGLAIIDNWIADEQKLNYGLTKNLTKNDSQFKILFMGWLEKTKGIFDLLESLKYLVEHFDVLLMVCGSGSENDAAQKYVQDNGLDKYVKFYGWVSGDAKIEVLNRADLFVLPSWSEGLPNSIIEAMCFKIPVISCNVGSIPDHFENYRDIIFNAPKDVSALSKSIEQLILNEKLRVQIAINGYNLVKDKFSSEKSIKKLSAIFQKATNDIIA
jgi:glycosyltransferase involved in cell wall biosynthesis